MLIIGADYHPAFQVTVRRLPEWRSKYVHLAMRRGRKIAKVAMARRLAVRLYCPIGPVRPAKPDENCLESKAE